MLVLTWKLREGSADAMTLIQHGTSSNEPHCDFSLCLTSLRLPVTMAPPRGVRAWPLFRQFSTRASISLDVKENSTTQLDDVAVAYAGRVKVVDVEVDFPCLVRAAALAVAPRLRDDYKKLQDQRPLLPSEEDYLRKIDEAASVR